MTDKPASEALTPAELLQLASAKPKGKRPQYFTDAMAEHSFSIIMALMAEVAVSRERIDTLERLLETKGVLSRSDVENYIPDDEAGRQRQLAQVEFSSRVLRSLQQQVEAMADKHELSIEEMAAKLGETDS